MKGRKIAVIFALLLVIVLPLAGYGIMRSSYPRPYREIAAGSGIEEELVFAVMKAESGFDEDAKSPAGAVGLMQLMPSTAEFVCRLNKIEFQAEKLTDGAYNTRLGCLYLRYLFGRFGNDETVLAAYNAGEGTVTEWLKDERYSSDGQILQAVPYPETARYLKKVANFRKKYRFFYH